MASSKHTWSGFKRKDREFSMNIEFDGVVLSADRAKLVDEFIKYILYQRQQIPLPFEQVKRRISDEGKNQTCKDNGRRRGPMKMDQRRCQEATDGLGRIYQTLTDVFTHGGPIRQVVVSLGATIMSPKEIYILSFPIGVYEGPVLSYSACRSLLFRKLVTCDFFVDAKPLKSLNKLAVLVSALRSCNPCSQNLHPKTNYKIPVRGQRLSVDLTCRTHESIADLTRLDDAYMDISGIEPLALMTPASLGSSDSLKVRSRISRWNSYPSNTSDCYMSTPMTANKPDFSSVCEQMMELELGRSGVKRARTHSIGFPEVEDADYIWYQVPFTMKGYREKAVKQATTADLWV